MAQALRVQTRRETVEATVARWRLILGGVVLSGALLFFFGTSWDIHWHTYIGRDRTLVPPHLLMLGGVALSGLAALTALLADTVRAWRDRGAGLPATPFAGPFRGALGAYLAGFAALEAAVAFPLDAYWHALYGIDVAIWAPFHVMFLVSMGAVALGAVYMLASGAHLAERAGLARAARLGNLGQVTAYAATLGLFTLLLFDALDADTPRLLQLGPVAINVFPLLGGVLGSWLLSAAAQTVPGRRPALRVAAVYLLLPLVVLLFVGRATDWLAAAEGLTYRSDRADLHLPEVAFLWPLAPVIAALLLDRVAARLRRPDGTLPWDPALLRALTICLVPIPVIGPAGVLIVLYTTGLVGLLPTVLLGAGGVVTGTWLGLRMGQAVRPLDR